MVLLCIAARQTTKPNQMKITELAAVSPLHIEIGEFTIKLEERLDAYKKSSGLTYFREYQVEIEIGRKVVRVFACEISHEGEETNRRIVCFIDFTTGEIFKPASYKAPAKHSRGNVKSDKNGMEAIDGSGSVHYLR